ncbi:hypothetical protein C2869_03365 [Saccharobesus litoralis]|uniref:Carbohydrate binding module (Family 6) n=1 Tax=Saccharobesus litoralis TaxID=2172099 RepID=A0A2S0VN70_9ALTE|nr:carbohydrate-binding protein [Saccharobesus litoralis]AWB65530.1 hypothetical protein C2869_03365 [Saccharobesus litoralis]
MALKMKALPFFIALALAGCNGDDNKTTQDPGCSADDCAQQKDNSAPVISASIVDPQDSYAIGTEIQISSQVSDADNNIAFVEYFWNGALIKRVTQAPFTMPSFVVPINASLGENMLSATVTDKEGAQASGEMRLVVEAALKPPTVALVLPTNDTPLVAGESLDLAVTASDKDGDIVKVEYYLAGEKLAESATAPDYTASLTLPEAGMHKLTLVAIDSDGLNHTVDSMLMVAADHSAYLNAPTKVHFQSRAPYSQLTAYWTDNSVNESGFVVEQQIEGSDTWTTLGQAAVDEEMLTISNFSRDETSLLRVRAIRDDLSSDGSEAIRIVGTNDTLEVYPQVPAIEANQMMTVTKDVTDDDGNLVTRDITFPLMQYQTPNEPDEGKATRVSRYFSAQVRTMDGEPLISPVYETRPQIRNFLAQNDRSHTYRSDNLSGHRPYGYGHYGPIEGELGSSLHSKHWTNFDASEKVIVRVRLNDEMGMVDMGDLEIHPTPVDVVKVDDQTFDVTLEGASDAAKHYRIAVNRNAWTNAANTADRGPITIEAPLFIFVNPMHVAPGSAPQGEIKEFNDGELVVFGSGIHLPNPKYQFLGEGGSVPAEDGGAQGNDVVREMYAPGDAFLHYGFLFKNDSYPLKVWGRAMYSDEMFNVYTTAEGDADGYVWSDRARSKWSHLDAIEGNPWGITQAWDTHVWLQGAYKAEPTVFEGFTNIGARMGVMVRNGKAEVNNHKDVGYGGGTYQDNGAEVAYKGSLLINDDDITYVHENYTMDQCTSYVMHNGPSFQLGWEGVFSGDRNIETKVTNHTILSSDRRTDSFWKNHGVFDSRLRIGPLQNHSGGVFENFEFYGKETVIFNLRIWDEGDTTPDTVSMISDKVFKDFNIRQASYNMEELLTEPNLSLNKQAYLRFFHFDNLVIEGEHIDTISEFEQYFKYDDGLLLHTMTLFSLPDAVDIDSVTNGYAQAPIGEYVAIMADNGSYVQSDETLPQSLSPLTANATAVDQGFVIEDAGENMVALRDYTGRYVQVDTGRYGYTHVQTLPSDDISDNAKFIWVDNGDSTFSLLSKANGLYLRMETSTSSEAPLYAASDSIGTAESFAYNAHIGQAPVFGKPPVTLALEAEATFGSDTARNSESGLKLENSGEQVGYTYDGAWFEFDVNMADVAYMHVRANTSNNVRTLKVYANYAELGENGYLGDITTVDIGGWGDYAWSDKVKLNAPTGGNVTSLRFVQVGGGINVDGYEATFVRYDVNELVLQAEDANRIGDKDGENPDAMKTEDTGDGGTARNHIGFGDWFEFDINQDSVTNLSISARVASFSGPKFTVYADGTMLGELQTTSTGGWKKYQEFGFESLDTSAIDKIDTLRIVVSSGVNVDWFKVNVGSVKPVKAAKQFVLDTATDSNILNVKADKLDSIKDGAWVSYDLDFAPVGDIKATIQHVGGSGGTASLYGIYDGGEELLGSFQLPGGGGWNDPYLSQEGTLDSDRNMAEYKGIRLQIDTSANYCCNIGGLKLDYTVAP